MLTGRGQTSCSDRVLLEHWEEARCEVAQKHGDNVDPSAGLPPLVTWASSSRRQNDYLSGLQVFRRRVCCLSEPALSGSKLESGGGSAGKGR